MYIHYEKKIMKKGSKLLNKKKKKLLNLRDIKINITTPLKLKGRESQNVYNNQGQETKINCMMLI